jgi:predicted site-specific integrase-resolvase
MMAVELPDKPFFFVKEVAQYFPVYISLTTIYRWIESGQLETVGPKYKLRITRDSLLKKLSQF